LDTLKGDLAGEKSQEKQTNDRGKGTKVLIFEMRQHTDA
jgi:hypothetical protein